MAKLGEVRDARYGSRQVEEMRLGGRVVWPVITYEIYVGATELYFTAAGGSKSFTVYGRTYKNGELISSELLRNGWTTRVVGSADWLGIESLGRVIRVFNAQNEATPEQTCGYEFTWTAHPEAVTMVTITRGANVRTPVGSEYTEILNNVPSTIIWDNSGNAMAMWSGDTASLDGIVTVQRKQDYEWSSGYEETDVISSRVDALHSVVTVSGEGLSVETSGSSTRRRHDLTYDTNASYYDRTGTVTFSYNYGGVSRTWQYTVQQHSQPADIQQIVIWQRGSLWTSLNKLKSDNWISWTFNLGDTVVQYYTPLNIEIGDPVYTTSALDVEVADTYIANVIL